MHTESIKDVLWVVPLQSQGEWEFGTFIAETVG